MINDLFSLVILFGSLSLMSIGGGNTVIPDIHREAVLLHHWLTEADFASAFAIARVAPGPGSLLVALIGWKVAGWTGAITSTIAMYAPSSLLAYFIGRIWRCFQDNPWKEVIEKGLAPITFGLIFASSWIIAQDVSHGLLAYMLIAITSFIVAKTKINPLLIMVIASLAGIANLI